MPIYQYDCPKCEYTVEHMHKHNESPVFKCEQCGKALVKVISGGAMLDFKGDGFYKPGKDVGDKK